MLDDVLEVDPVEVDAIELLLVVVEVVVDFVDDRLTAKYVPTTKIITITTATTTTTFLARPRLPLLLGKRIEISESRKIAIVFNC